MHKKTIYQFTLVLSGVDDKTQQLEDKLYEAGCDDALINFRNGTVYLDFEREAVSFEEAVISAIKAIEQTTLGAIVVSVSPDNFVSESDIAKRLHTNRQRVSLWVKGARRTKHPFPNPVMKLTGKSPLWRWLDVVKWLQRHKELTDPTLLEEAQLIESVNIALLDRDKTIRSYKNKLLRKLQ